MAELFGVVAGAAGLLQAANEIRKGAKTIRNARNHFKEAPEDICDLADDLENLTVTMELLTTSAGMIEQCWPQGAPLLQACEKQCKAVVSALENMKSRYIDTLDSKGSARLMRKYEFRAWDQDVRRLRDRIESAKLSVNT